MILTGKVVQVGQMVDYDEQGHPAPSFNGFMVECEDLDSLRELGGALYEKRSITIERAE